MKLTRRKWLLGGLAASALAVSGFVWLHSRGPVGSSRRPAVPTDHLRHLPADTRIVVTIAPGALPEDGRAWKAVGEKLYDIHLTSRAGEAPALTGVSCITIGMPDTGSTRATMIVRGKVDRSLLTKQLGASKEWRQSPGDPAVYWRGTAGPSPLEVGTASISTSTIYLAAVDDDTLLFTVELGIPGVDAIKQLVGIRPAGETRLRDALKAGPTTRPSLDPSLAKLIEERDPEAWLSFAVLGNSLAAYQKLTMPDVDATFQKFDHLTAGLRTADDSELTITATGKNETLAQEMEKDARGNAKMLKDVIPALGPTRPQKQVLEELVGSLTVLRRGRVVTVKSCIATIKTKVLVPVVRK